MTIRLRMKRHTGAFGVPLLILVLLVVGVQLAIFGAVVDRTLGFAALTDPDEFGTVVQKPSVALLRSNASAQLVPAQSDYYFELSRQWQVVLRDAGIPFTTISDAELASGVADSHTVLVLPSARCLGEAQRQRIASFLAAGKGIVASGGLGARDADCKWAGYDYLTKITGLQSPYPVPASSAEHAIFRGDRYFSGTLPAGSALPLPDQELIAGRSTDPDIFRGDARLRAASAAPLEQSALAVHGYRDRGRFVWYGFNETQPASKTSTRRQLDGFLVSAVRWAARQPLSAVAAWPANRQSAVLVGETMGDDARGAAAAAAMFQRTGVPATFFVPGALATSHAGAVETLSKAGEIASMGDSDEVFSDQDVKRQAERLKRAASNLAALRPVGFYPPSEEVNRETRQALLNSHFTYLLHSGAEPATASPELFEPPQKTWLRMERAAVVRFDRPWSDDFEVIANYQGPQPWQKDLGQGFLNEFEHARKLGGLYTFLFHSTLLGAPENLHIVESVLESIRSRSAWMASGKQLANWWMDRDRLNVVSRMVNRQRVRLAVTNRGENPVDNAAVVVHLPYRPDTVRLIPAVHGVRPPAIKIDKQRETMQLDFSSIPARSSYIYVVALNEE